MAHANCPACGAPVEFVSTASAFAVCPYCDSGLARDGHTLTNLGKVGTIFEDYTPLQLGVSGVFEGQGFTVVGRIQMAYSRGFWNEWYVLLDDGGAAWLSDAAGQYTFLKAAQPVRLPALEDLVVGHVAPFLSGWVVSDLREAECTGAQGELPFPVSERWTARFADLRKGNQFATLDGSDGMLTFYTGQSVKLADLRCQLLRDEVTINVQSGRIKGKIEALSCPQCGHTVKAVAGATHIAHCPACGSQLDVSGKTALLMESGQQAHRKMEGLTFLPGDTGALEGRPWTVLGVLEQHAEFGEDLYGWFEYLLFNPGQGFRWLSELSDGTWLLGQVLDDWPAPGTDIVRLHGETFKQVEAYTSKVTAAWGSFNWMVQHGDTAYCVEYEPNAGMAGRRLICETTDTEQGWALCAPISADTIYLAFRKGTPPSPDAFKPQTPWRLADYGRLDLVGWGAMGHLFVWVSVPSGVGFLIALVSLLALLALNFVDTGNDA